MIGFDEFMAWAQSPRSADRAKAAVLVASAHAEHDGPADEQAALFAALIGFVDDPSVKVRAALAYGLLKSDKAPRVAMVALAKDSPVIARAVLQYSPVLVDADLIDRIETGEPVLLEAIAAREDLSMRVADALVRSGVHSVVLSTLRRSDVEFSTDVIAECATVLGDNPEVRGALLARNDLPAAERWNLLRKAAAAMRSGRLVQGALTGARQDRMFREELDSAACTIGGAADEREFTSFVGRLRDDKFLSTRLMMHALLCGHVRFFAEALSCICSTPPKKVLNVLARGSRPALHALLSRSGMAPGLQNLLARMIVLAREMDLTSGSAARLFVVTVLIEELVTEHSGAVPDSLRSAFAYLNEMNLKLAREAARGVMPGFVAHSDQRAGIAITDRASDAMALPQKQLPAA